MKSPSNFERLVLGCIDSYDSDQRLTLLHFSRSTRFTFLCTAQISKFQEKKVSFFFSDARVFFKTRQTFFSFQIYVKIMGLQKSKIHKSVSNTFYVWKINSGIVRMFLKVISGFEKSLKSQFLDLKTKLSICPPLSKI